MPKTRDRNRLNQKTHNLNGESCSKCNCPILIVEKHKLFAMMLATKIQERYGHSTEIVGTLAEAEKLIDAQAVHLAIADLNLPDAPHGEIIDMLTRHQISTIALTGKFCHEMRDTVLSKGVIDYIPKQTPHLIDYAVEIANRIYRNHHTNVLIVEDSLIERELLKHFLERQQFKVISASNADEALVILDQQIGIQLAFVDYEMPGMNGVELIHKIRRKFSKEELAIIGISGTDNSDITAYYLKSGANDFIYKPFSYEETLCRIGQNMEMLDLIQANRKAAHSDFLTGLHNRRYFFSEGENLYRQARSGRIVAAMLDVDHFKKINDTHGHECGDEVLIHLAGLLDRHFGNHLVARLGGEEFAIIFDDVSSCDARNLLEAFRQEVENTPATSGETLIPFTISIGMTDQLGESIDEFIHLADKHLYHAKNLGRNRVVSDS